MSITVKGVKVRSKDVKREIKVGFGSLKKSAQKRLLKENVDLFFLEALSSKHSSVRALAITLKDMCYSATINKAIRATLKNSYPGGFEQYDANLVMELLSVRDLQLAPDLRKRLSITEYWGIRNWIALDNATPVEMLNNMLLREARNFVTYGSTQPFDFIVQNKNFELKEKTKEELYSDFSEDDYLRIMERIEKVQNKE